MKTILLTILLFFCLNVHAQIEALERSAEKGDISALIFLGENYLKGNRSIGVNRNISKGIKYLKEAAENFDNAKAQYLLAEHYLYSDGNKQTILSLLKKSSESNYAPSQVLLADIYTQNASLNKKDAFKLYKSAASQHYPPAYNGLGDCYRFGRGCDKSFIEAKKYYQMALNKGLNIAYIGLAMTDDDKNQAIGYAQKAKELGYADGYSILAYYFASENQYNKAHDLLQEAIELIQNEKITVVYSPLIGFMSMDGDMYYKEQKMQDAYKVWSNMKQLFPEIIKNLNDNFAIAMRKYESSSIDIEIPKTDLKYDNAFALIIANENYKNVSSVPYAINDGETFKRYCIETFGIPQNNIMSIKDASLNEIRYGLQWISKVSQSMNGKAKIYIYYAGHGIPNESTMSAYLLPIDGYGDDPESAIDLTVIYKMIGACNAKQTIITLDACFSGAKRTGDMLYSARGVAIKIKDDVPLGNTVVFSASHGDETAFPYEEQKHGMFTFYLLKAIKENDGKINLGALIDKVQMTVGQQSLKINQKSQTPTMIPSQSVGTDWRQWTY